MSAILAESLAKRYENGIWGVRDVSFSVEWGSIAVLLGPNGAGKTTTVGILSTILKPTKGRGVVAGYDVVHEANLVRRRIAIVSQEGRIDLNWTPLEAIKWYLVARGWSLSSAEREAKYWLEALNLWSKRNVAGWRLSGGERRKVVVAMALASNADVVFLDEPTTGLDVESRYIVWSAIQRVVDKERAILMTTHSMEEAWRLANKVIIIHKGIVLAEGEPRRLVKELPFKFRVRLRRPARRIIVENSVRLGDELIVYTYSLDDALKIAEELSPSSFEVEQVGLEDVYIYYTRVKRLGDES